MDYAAFIVVAVVILYLMSSIKILREYERGVIFRLGRVLHEPKGPGVILVFAPIDRIVRISLRVDTLEVPSQDVVTKDNVTLKVNAVVYFRVVDPVAAVVKVENYWKATSLIAQTTLRSVVGQAELDELLAHRDKINQTLQEIIDRQTDPWGIKASAKEKGIESKKDDNNNDNDNSSSCNHNNFNNDDDDNSSEPLIRCVFCVVGGASGGERRSAAAAAAAGDGRRGGGRA